MKKRKIAVFKIFLLSVLFLPLSCFDTSPVLDESGNSYQYVFASGPKNGDWYNFADGFIDAASQTMGIFLDNAATSGSLDNAAMLVKRQAYMGLIQEDLFRYCRDRYIQQYTASPDTAEKIYLQIASQVNVLMAGYRESVFLLVKSDISNIAGLTGKKVNIGPERSNTMITAASVLGAHGISYTPLNLETADAVNYVVSGSTDCDAVFIVGSSPNPILQSIPAGAAVKLIRVYMPAGKKYYDETGTLSSEDYPFQTENISQNMTVATLLAVGPYFTGNSIGLFIDFVLKNSAEYENFSSKWKDVSRTGSFDYIRKNPQLVDYNAFCAIATAPALEASNISTDFYTAEAGSSYSDIATELIWLMSHNIGIDLKPHTSTGSVENGIRMADGKAAFAIVQDDLFYHLENTSMMMNSLQVATMKKIMPLHYEYLHLLVNDASGIASIADFTGKEINLGPKTSGTFLTAMSLVKTYGFNEASNVHYSFDSPGDAVIKVNTLKPAAPSFTDSYYDASFVMSGLPYYRFYSKDTWSVITDLSRCGLITCAFNGSTIPYPYNTDGAGKLWGNYNVQSTYPYQTAILSPASISTIRVRAVMVASPVFDDSNISTFIKSVFRKSYYNTNPTDPDLWKTGAFQPEQIWIPIRKDSIKKVEDLDDYDTGIKVSSLSDRGIYDDRIIGAKEYFVNNPFGWSRKSAEYYLSMFPDN